MSTTAATATTAQQPTRPSSRDPVPALTRLLARAVRGLGEAGHPVAASRLAADAWVLLRHPYPAEAGRVTGTLHYLARLPEADPAEAIPTIEETAVIIEDRELDVRLEPPARRPGRLAISGVTPARVTSVIN